MEKLWTPRCAGVRPVFVSMSTLGVLWEWEACSNHHVGAS